MNRLIKIKFKLFDIKDFNTTKIIKFCLYIFEIYFSPVYEFNLDKII